MNKVLGVSRSAVIIHGSCDKGEYFDEKYPSLSNSHWLAWLQKQLLVRGVLTQTPEMPEPFEPQYELWKREFERFEINPETILIGHNCGAGFLVRWLSENMVQGGKLILVAPWLDPGREETTDFFEFEMDSKLCERFDEVHLLVSLDDDGSILKSVEMIKKEIGGIKIHEFNDRGHFTFEDLGSEKFEELLEIVC